MTWASIGLLVGIPVGAGLLVLVVSPRRRVWLRYTAMAAMGATLPLVATAGIGVRHPLAVWEYALTAVFSVMALWYSGPYVDAEQKQHGWTNRRVQLYYLLLYGFMASMMAMAVVPNYLLMWAALEGATLSSAGLVGISGSQSGTEASWKYLVLTESGGLAALVGTVLIVGASGDPSTLSAGVAWAGSVAGSRAMALGVVLASIGYATKAGLAPFHLWLPDAHSEAPAPVSALLSGVKLSGALIILLRLLHVASRAIPALDMQGFLVAIGLLSLVIAAAFVGSQRELKRLWAYSSVEHIGLICLGAGFGGIGLLGALLHIWTHAVTKTLLFYNAGTVRILYHSSSLDGGARDLLGRTPWTGALLGVGATAIAGIPPFAPFWSEWLILSGGFQNAVFRPAVWVAMGLLAIIFAGIVRQVPRWLFIPGRVPPVRPAQAAAIQEPWRQVSPALVLAVGTVVGGIAMPVLFHHLWLAAAGSVEMQGGVSHVAAR